ncbi:MAG: SDR family NAD(P)-dependent oxidoreductase [Verrucomicrobiota bacterium]|nr:SDR family NAD(P)-dependent oxidoreductase [Verrucomicrobiota bacterium]
MSGEGQRFSGQVAVVTGAAEGIGFHLAARLAREGARVVLLDRQSALLESSAAQISGSGWKVADVADDAAVCAAFGSIMEEYGRIDIAVNCAGIVGPNARRLTEVGVDEFDEVYAVNLRGSFLVTKYASNHMEKAGYGRILLFASIAGKEGNAGMCAYSATKAGVIGLAKSAGKDFAETGITVNAIAPAVIRTGMVEALDQWQVDYMTEKIPMKRCGTLDEVAALACWIVSREASFTTGAVFDLSGGRATY